MKAFIAFQKALGSYGPSLLWRDLGNKHPETYGFDARRARQLTHYCIVRRDLPRGVLAAMLIHAAGESTPFCVPEGTLAVALGVQGLAELEALELKLLEHGVPHKAVREPDAPWLGELMAIGIEPVENRSILKHITGSLPLLK